MFWFFGWEACGILALQSRMEPILSALEGEIITTGPPRKSPVFVFYDWLVSLSLMSFFGGQGGVAVLGLHFDDHTSLVVVHRLNCPKTCSILVPWTGIKPTLPAFEGRFFFFFFFFEDRFLTTDLPGMSQLSLMSYSLTTCMLRCSVMSDSLQPYGL